MYFLYLDLTDLAIIFIYKKKSKVLIRYACISILIAYFSIL